MYRNMGWLKHSYPSENKLNEMLVGHRHNDEPWPQQILLTYAEYSRDLSISHLLFDLEIMLQYIVFQFRPSITTALDQYILTVCEGTAVKKTWKMVLKPYKSNPNINKVPLKGNIYYIC